MTQETTIEEQQDVTTTDTLDDSVSNADATPEAEVNGVDPENEGTQTDPPEPDSFPREYVEKLRDENAKYRRRAGQSDVLAQRLHTALTAATGRLQDPTDLPYDAAHLDDPEALEQAIDDLLKAKPHLGARRPTGSIGQGQTSTTNMVDLAGILRANA
ncbi:hypothetical protein [Ancrocorticia populi]|uniref:Uncharacterized protein n=1 Tax=Ancrocorticia populi TaxID=2175228 RepID=A0A2V1K774_9ACTO|nr:hypothetical protein [Ancrocorticia populi]PWF26037.1 hypothetical protein DD236_08050 [Ancrocorticia populi]